jgi:hypothetical protein
LATALDEATSIRTLFESLPLARIFGKRDDKTAKQFDWQKAIRIGAIPMDQTSRAI